MIKVVAIIKAKPELSREEFLRRWHEEHPAYVEKLPGLRGYRQSPAIAHRKTWPFSGMAELYFDDIAAVRTAYAGVEARAMMAHEEDFLESMEWFLADEVMVLGRQ